MRASCRALSGARRPPPVRSPGRSLTATGVRLEFNGQRLNANIAVSPPKPESKAVLAPLRASATALAAKKMDQLYALHTPKSTAKLKQWFASMTPEMFDSYVHYAVSTAIRQVRARRGTSAIVFSAETEANTWPAGGLHYDYLLRDTGRYRIANVHYESFFDDLLKASPALKELIRNERGRLPQVR